MTATVTRPRLGRPPIGGRRRSRTLALAAVAVLAVGAATVAFALDRDTTPPHYLAATGWPVHGQASYQLGDGSSVSSPGQRPVPIASVAKVMTAYLTLAARPLDDAPFLTVTAHDVADERRRAAADESVVRVAQGETFTELQALEALMLPSANNVAGMIARRLDGSVPAFVVRMNRAARNLGLRHTVYTDPSGLDARTVSTGADQLRLADVAMRNPDFAALVGTSDAILPVVGRVHNTDTLLGKSGFVGIKTGSDDAAGGCFVFQTWRNVHGTVLPLTGVVLGQPGDNLIESALTAARQLADHVAPHLGQA